MPADDGERLKQVAQCNLTPFTHLKAFQPELEMWREIRASSLCIHCLISLHFYNVVRFISFVLSKNKQKKQRQNFERSPEVCAFN